MKVLERANFIWGNDMKQHRTSQKQIETEVNNINYFTFHKVKAFFTQGCGTHLTIDGKEYNHLRKDGSVAGLSPKRCMEILQPYHEEAIRNAIIEQKELEESCNCSNQISK